MGWAARARVGFWERVQQRARREKLTKNLLPRLIWHQLMHLVVALVLFPFRLIRLIWGGVWKAKRSAPASSVASGTRYPKT